MHKVLLIIQREYLTRVRKKSFIVMTLLVPALFALMYKIIAYVADDKNDVKATHIVHVVDSAGIYQGKLKDSRYVKFDYSSNTLTALKAEVKEQENDLVLYIPTHKPEVVQVFAKKKSTLSLSDALERQLNDIASGSALVKAGIDTARLHRIKSNIVVNANEITETGDQSTSIGATYALSFAGAILIYMSLFIYGAQVMRGVIEEKTSRIIEVIVSSVKPFQLMAGKIIGVGLVGLTQFVLWISLSALVSYLAGQNAAQASPVYTFIHNLGANAGYELGCFLFYWLSGFLLYSALFAAVGSAVDSETETQQFMFPITLPLLFTYILSVSYLFQKPDSTLAFWLSIIPLTAPVAMMVRVPFGVPDWQLGLSMALMVAGFVFTTWVASRIYRVGILMYGKKVNFKELGKWFFYKE
jgi:ABC-2 type transport system permease protein